LQLQKILFSFFSLLPLSAIYIQKTSHRYLPGQSIAMTAIRYLRSIQIFAVRSSGRITVGGSGAGPPFVLRQRDPAVSSSIRCFASSGNSNGNNQNGNDFFREQMEELNRERQELFGNDEDMSTLSSQQPTTNATQEHAFFEQQMNELNQEKMEIFGDSENTDNQRPDFATGEDLKMLKEEREELYQFTSEERTAWASSSGGESMSSDLLEQIKLARKLQAQQEEKRQEDIEEVVAAAAASTSTQTQPSSSPTIEEDSSHEAFTHVSEDGSSIHMVDVGNKVPSRRTARARCTVILPPEVMEAFEVSHGDLIGPKGPIFATAKIAGIMAAKKTSDLIPLCHPLPLEKVEVDMVLRGNQVHIECECRVTHKTGVEMEALMGANVAALTIYDMTKAVSHEITITDTKLVSKRGGKRKVGPD
jgi:cyclic pyranopterin monophosphate synthase